MAGASATLYSPLPAQHFRLLQIREDNGRIHASLSIHNLDQAPGYVALSYTWDRAEESHFSLDARLQSSPSSIILNGQTHQVTPNLHDFFSLALLLDGISQTWLWIDAICINQSDDLEKTVQVNLMGMIYSRAVATFVWLGKEDRQTEQTQVIIHKMGQTLKKRVGHESDSVLQEEFGRVQPTDTDYLRRMGLDASTTWEDWFGLVRFFQRRWFRRAWTIQEVALAEMAVVRCGPHIFDWDDLWHCNWALSNTPLGAVLRIKAEKHFGTNDINFMFGTDAFTAIVAHKPAELLQTQPFVEWRVRDKPEFAPAATWARLVGLLRHAGATDSRDRIFSLGGVWEKMAAEPLRSALIRPADYRKSARVVFIETMTDLLNTTKCLNFLSLIQPGDSVTSDLPSWVADYAGTSATPIVQFLAINGMLNKVNASKDTTEPSQGFSITSNNLQLSTITIGTVTEVGDSWAELNDGHFDKTLDLLLASLKSHREASGAIARFCSVLLFDMDERTKQPGPRAFWNFFMLILLTGITRKVQQGAVVADCLADTAISLGRIAGLDKLHRFPSQSELIQEAEKLSLGAISAGQPRKDGLDAFRENSHDVRLILLQTLYGRRTFLLDTGHFGITAENIKLGNTIRIVPGARALFAFEKAKDTSPGLRAQHLVGEAYVSEAMNGEVIESIRQRGEECQWEKIVLM
ncbi:Heterokaryon incompatibility protein [Paramyrothecium foliicola]|nr:Heterokaryon incompatibility protein [Paramyrothecium foliicola]